MKTIQKCKQFGREALSCPIVAQSVHIVWAPSQIMTITWDSNARRCQASSKPASGGNNLLTCAISVGLIYIDGKISAETRGTKLMKTRKRSRRQRNRGAASSRQRRNNWVVWTMVVLMLAAMAMYVLSLDESMIP